MGRLLTLLHVTVIFSLCFASEGFSRSYDNQSASPKKLTLKMEPANKVSVDGIIKFTAKNARKAKFVTLYYGQAVNGDQIINPEIAHKKLPTNQGIAKFTVRAKNLDAARYYFQVKQDIPNFGESNITVIDVIANTSDHECNDGIDNDGDGLVDWQYDLGCTSAEDGTEGGNVGGSIENGWTVFEPSADTQIIYVSSSDGNDNNDGFSPQTALKSPSVGLDKLESLDPDRVGKPNWLLLKRGDVFNGTLGQLNRFGRSETEPMVISTYGPSSERPVLRIGGSTGFSAKVEETPVDDSHVAIVGIEFYAHTRDYTSNEYQSSDGGTAINWAQPGKGFLVEDCKISFADVIVQARHHNYTARFIEDFKMRRSIVERPYATDGHSSGIYVYNTKGITMEDNVFHHLGFDESREGGQSEGGATKFNQGMYIDNENPYYGHTDGVTLDQRELIFVRGNIIADAAAAGIQLRPGGILEDNLLLRNPIGASIGHGDGHEDKNPDGVDFLARNNVIAEGNDINSTLPRGWGMDTHNTRNGEIVDNILSNNIDCNCPYPRGFGIWGTGGSEYNGEIRDDSSIKFLNNRAFAWKHKSFGQSDDFNFAPTVENSYFYELPAAWGSNHNVIDEDIEFADAERSVGSYNGALGGVATYEAFMDEALKQSKYNWRPAFTAYSVNQYIRDGFLVQ